jgi:hypothetical protein
VQCNRRCLESFVDALLTALVRKDPRHLPGTDTLTYTENGQRLAVGDGLWGTVTALGAYRVVAVDPDTQTAVFVGSITETDVQGLLFARLTLQADRVAEVEAFVVRHEFTGDRGGTLTLFAPRLSTAFDPARFLSPDPALSLTLPFDSPTTPAALSAITAEHSTALTPPGTTTRDRRTWVADAERGLVVDLAFLDVVNDEIGTPELRAQLPAVSSGPYSLITARLYKIVAGGVTTEVSATLPAPYGIRSSWNQ